MMEWTYALLAIVAAAVLAGLIVWLVVGRGAAVLRSERDQFRERFRTAIADLEGEVRRREQAEHDLTALTAEQDAAVRAHAAQVAQLEQARDALSAQFREVGSAMLDQAQRAFLERADQRFRESEATAGQNLKALLTPVHDRLEKYEREVGRIEAERRETYGNLSGLIDAMRVGQEDVKRVTASLNNSLRNAPKARGRWGEHQLKNVLEQAGLSEHVDFLTEVSVTTDEGRLRPDVIIHVPGGRQLVIDAKVSLNAYQDAFDADDEGARRSRLAEHAAAIKAHVTTLGARAYHAQFQAAPDYVIMFIPGEHFLSAALEQDPNLWDYAFGRNVLLATPTNLVAIAKTIAGVWRQERMAEEAREIGALGRDLYARLAKMGEHLGRLGRNLNQTASAYNDLVGNIESQVLTQAKRFEGLGVDTGAKEIPASLPPVDTAIRPLAKLAPAKPAAVNDGSER